MTTVILADTGPLVALFNRNDAHHRWALSRFREFTEPLVTAEPVLTESLHLLRRAPGGGEKLLTLWQRGLVIAALSIEVEKPSLLVLMRRYADIPVSLADACLIRLAEIHPRCKVWTLDTDFRVYRRNGRQAIPVLAPS
ncbi:MAG: PIN domain-containing protein [Myxococcota bacterium]|nr:PIN domain-containing protein [Myxococcota bacterium]